MAVKIRLARAGTKKRPFYRIVAADARSPRDGRFIERLGSYNPLLPHENDSRVVAIVDRIKYWISVGAQVSERVALLLGEKGVMEKPQIHNRPKKSAPKKKAQERIAAESEAAASNS